MFYLAVKVRARVIVYRLMFVAVLGLILVNATWAQTTTTSATDAKTPSGLTPGAPAGSYALSGFDNINLYNGNLNFRLPLARIGGRGTAGYTMTLALNTKRWRTRYTSQTTNGEITHETWTPTQSEWQGNLTVGYGPGIVIGRSVGLDRHDPPNCSTNPGVYKYTLSRLVFKAPDGSEYEMRDAGTNGQPQAVPRSPACGNPTLPGFNRGRVFVTADGSAATFIADADIQDTNRVATTGVWFFYPSGYLLLRDGTRYRIDSGNVTWIRDRNGNQVSPGVDSLGRTVTINYGVSDAAPYGLCDQIVFKGKGGDQRILRVSYDTLANTLRPGYTIQTYSSLFPQLNGANNYVPNTWNPSGFVSAVWLPDGRKYRFFYNPYGELARVELPTGGAIEYDYTPSSGVISGGGPNGSDYQIYRRVIERRTYKDGVTLEGKITYPIDANGAFTGVVIHKDANDVALAHETHSFLSGGPSASGSLFWPTNQGLYSSWSEGREGSSSVDKADGSSAVRTTTMNWQQRAPISWLSWWANQSQYFVHVFLYPGDDPANDPRVVETTNTLVDTNQVSKSTSLTPGSGVPAFDAYNNPTDVWEYDFGPGAPGALLRRTHTEYLTSGYDTVAGGTTNPDPVNTIHLRALLTKQQVFDGGGTLRAQTDYEYDNYNQTSPDAFHAALTARANISGLCDGSALNCSGSPNFTDVNFRSRGNVTKTTRSLINSGGTITGSINSYAQYDVAGNVVKLLDPRSTTSNLIATTFDFRDNFGGPDGSAQSSGNPANTVPTELSSGKFTYAFPFKVINALGHTSYTQYDYYIGKPVDSEDPNGVRASLYYDDNLDRPTKALQAIGTGAAAQTLIVYNDQNVAVGGNPPYSITTISDKDSYGESNGGGGLKSLVLYDGLGRTRRKAAYEGSNTWSITDTQFDALGRVWRTNNPWRDSDPAAAVPSSALWTTTGYDALSRVTSVQTPDTSIVTTAYDGARVMVTDQTQKRRISESDALGRLVKVWELKSADGATVGINFPQTGGTAYNGYLTQYSYDALDDLTLVTQGSQTRTFVYDALKRLTSATNPENGTISYQYDNAGNLTQKTDARPVTANYTYDALNRNTSIGYNDGTPVAERYYDGATNGKGRFWYNLSYNYHPVSAQLAYCYTVTNSYDAVGRPLSGSQQFYNGSAWVPYNLSRTYDLAGNVKSQSYPSGRSVNYNYDTAGRLSSFGSGSGGGIGDGATRTYVDSISYTAAGQMTRERFGTVTSLYHNVHYNKRLQAVDVRLGTSSTDEWTWNRGALITYYSDAARAAGNAFNDPDSGNSGNVTMQEHYVPLDDAISSYVIAQRDIYDYDALNRISQVTGQQRTTGGSYPTIYTQGYSYDRWGNRTINAGATTGANVNNTVFTVNSANNRFTGLSYDNAGNVTNDTVTGAGARTYDAENRMISAQAFSGGPSYYVYDADGRRVRRIVAGAETWQVYGFGGELVAEYAANGATGSPQKEYATGGQTLIVGDAAQVRWTVKDALGTPRIVAGKNGTLAEVTRHDYMPFGEEFFTATGNSSVRTTAMGYTTAGTADGIRQKFTGQERDSETALDFVQARYRSPIQGRFMSVDPENADADLDSPQSWNGYAYARNNPQIYTDPTGRSVQICGPDGKNCVQHPDKDFANLRKYCEASGQCRIADDRLTGGRIIQGGKVIATFGNDLDNTAAGAFVSNMHDRAPALKTAVTILAGVAVAEIALPIIALEGGGLATIARFCFVEGTPVLTENGLKPIDKIKAGDKVLSFNERTRKNEYKTVLRATMRVAEAKHLLFIEVDGEANPLGVTDTHPFYVQTCNVKSNTLLKDEEGTWTEAGRLQVGDKVRIANGGWAKVRSIAQEKEDLKVYNFEVADNHNYFVGNLHLLAHNGPNDCLKVLQSGGNTLRRGTVKALQQAYQNETGREVTKEALKQAIEALKRSELGPAANATHETILANGDVIRETGELIGNIFQYLP